MDIRPMLKTLAQEKKIILTEAQLLQFQNYLSLLLEWNERMNLTAITDPSEIVVKHFLDSLLLSKFLPERDDFTFADIGTGAGFPGIPLQILRPKTRLVLIDSLQKRISFLETVCCMLSLQVKCVHARAEDCGRNPAFREKFDFVSARAVAPLPVLLEYCLPLLKYGGTFVAMKGPAGKEEAKASVNAVRLLGGGEIKLEEMNLSEDMVRSFIQIKKINPTPPQYPRRGVKIAKSPL